MRRRAVFSFIAACLLASCAHQTAPQVAAVDGMRWIEVEGDDPKLAFGMPDSDVLVLMMTCEARSGQVALAVFGGEGSELQLRSGRSQARLTALQGGTPLHENIVESALPAAAPVLASFARTGELAVGVGASPIALPAAEPAKAGRFVSRCL
jgi:hypothetical protein